MRILPKKKFRLRARDGSVYDTEPLVIQDIDDKFSSCRMFQLAQKDGDINVLDTKAAQKKAENGEDSTEKKQLFLRAAELGQNVSNRMSVTKLRELIAEAEKALKDDNKADVSGDGKKDGDINDSAGNDGNDAV